jgi:hypothetical protein
MGSFDDIVFQIHVDDHIGFRGAATCVYNYFVGSSNGCL